MLTRTSQLCPERAGLSWEVGVGGVGGGGAGEQELARRKGQGRQETDGAGRLLTLGT